MNECDFLIMLVNKELEEEYATNDDKEWLSNLIQAKAWLYKKQRTDKMVGFLDINNDIEKYLK